MKRFKRYEWYKDSGVEWIGKIPLHWEQVRMKFLCKVNPSKSDLKVPRNTKVTFLPMENIGEDGTLNLNEERELTDVWDGFTYFKDDDVIIAKITPCFENGKGALCRNLINGLGFGTTELHVLRAKNQVVPGFIWYVTKSHGFRVMGEAMMQGAAGQKRVPKDFIENFVVCVPTPVEQQAIVNFLDRKTAEIDSIIADKEKLIELLQEKRQAIITQAVTKGLDPNVPLKDSGVEWIGEIPEHWEVKPLKRLTSFISRGITPTYVDVSSVKVINQACIYWEKLNIENIKYQKEDLDISKGRLYKGDLVINSTGTGTLGRAAIFNLEGSCIADTHVTIIRSDKNSLNNRYLFYLLQTPKYQSYIYSALVTGATNQIELSREGLQNTIIICPFIEEQQAIANFLDQKTTEIDLLISDIKTQIFSLKEYRQSLITAAVTGKIDVRDYIVDNDKEEGEEQEEVS